ncbi:MAG: ABC transporter ATP-binding protein [Candidatus Shapirobacteria bacterium]|nr:ABC transporter ATP-binding protein [Candidatus Shapirobacteria bacterium]
MWKIYLKYSRFLWKYRKMMLGFWISLVLTVILDNLSPYFYKLFIDIIPTEKWTILFKILMLYVGSRLLSEILENVMRSLGDLALFPASRDARSGVVKKIHKLDFAFHTSKSTGSLISLIKRGDGAFFDFFHSVNINISRTLIGFIIMLIFLFRVRWEFAALSFVSFGLILLSSRKLIRNNMKARKSFNESEDEISEIIVDNLINFETVKLFAKEKWEQKRLLNSFETWIKKLWDYSMSFRIINLVVAGIGNLGLALVLLLGIKYLSTKTITMGDYILIISFITTFYYQFFELIYVLRDVAKQTVDMEKYFGILDEKEKVKDPKNAIILDKIKGEISFKEVNFNYPKNKNKAVKNINLIIKPGQSVAFVGHSGVGKTTLVKLLMRFYDPNSGEILLDGINIKKLKKSNLRSFMGVVPQEPVMFNKSIKYNIAYGIDDVNEESIKAAAKLANLDEFICSLSKKYETNVGERGVKLSGGQKQRLAIARMILKNPEIIIFDEATSQLDSESEKLIQDAFWKAAENKTTIIIAHRLSTIIKAEKIVVMEKGEIKEVGSHRKLLADENSLYSKFWKLQSDR